MDLDKLEKMAKLVLKELSSFPEDSWCDDNPHINAKFKNLMNLGIKSLPEHQELFTTGYDQFFQAHSIVRHLLDIIRIERSSITKIEEMKIFESADEKLKKANLSFGKGDYASVFHSLNTALELVLKDKIGIPITLTGINTTNVIEVLAKDKIEPYLYLNEAKKRVVMIDNKVKHQSYKPSKIDCINGIKAMEDVISRLRNTEMKLTEEVRNKIFKNL